ncbi:MAG: alpha/beta fold hydrolase [Promethearchaeota archaeon]
MDWLKEIEEKYISVNGIKLHTVVIGSGEPLILLHGFPDFWYGWKSIIPKLKDDFELIIPDLRGFNLSDKPKGIRNYRIELLVDDIHALSEKLNLSRFFLAGHDWGAVISWAFAEKYPKKVKKLAILNGPHPKIFQEKLRTDKDQQKASFYIFEFLKPDGEKFAYENDYKWLKWALFEGMINKKDFTELDKQKYLDAWSQPNAVLSGVNYYRANLNFDNWTGIVSQPTLVIHGMQDKAVLPQTLDGLSEYVKDLTIAKINASHWVMHDKPEVVVEKFQKFFKN